MKAIVALLLAALLVIPAIPALATYETMPIPFEADAPPMPFEAVNDAPPVPFEFLSLPLELVAFEAELATLGFVMEADVRLPHFLPRLRSQERQAMREDRRAMRGEGGPLRGLFGRLFSRFRERRGMAGDCGY